MIRLQPGLGGRVLCRNLDLLHGEILGRVIGAAQVPALRSGGGVQ